LAENLFKQVTADMPSATTIRNINSTTIYAGDNVVQCDRAIKRLISRLEYATLDNATQSTNGPPKPRNDSCDLEITKLVKLCVENDLNLPLKTRRRSLGFDDVDELIMIGRSNSAIQMPYREHVAPACLIKKEVLKMTGRRATAEAIANFIRHHLYVVIISPGEERLLNLNQYTGGISAK
jgi:hypothetical protein